MIIEHDSGNQLEVLPWGTPGKFTGVISGSSKNRGEFSSINVNTDAEAVAVWIADTGSSSENTAQAYRREAERLLLWASAVKGKSLSQLFREDYLEFAKFLSSIPEEWIMRKRYRRDSDQWRPYLQQPSKSSQRQTMIILKSLINYLIQAGWLRSNPMPASQSKQYAKKPPIHRSLTPSEIECIIEYLGSMPETSPRKTTIKARDQWLFYLFWTMAPRRGEVSLPMSSFVKRPIDGELTWMWDIVGKGNKENEQVLHPKAITKMMEFRVKLRISAIPRKNDPIPIMPSLEGMTDEGLLLRIPAAMSPNAIHKRFKKIFAAAADIADKAGIDSSNLRVCSTHWLRHTSIREIYDKTGNIKIAQQHGRHADINTTAGYSIQDHAAMKEAMFSS